MITGKNKWNVAVFAALLCALFIVAAPRAARADAFEVTDKSITDMSLEGRQTAAASLSASAVQDYSYVTTVYAAKGAAEIPADAFRVFATSEEVALVSKYFNASQGPNDILVVLMDEMNRVLKIIPLSAASAPRGNMAGVVRVKFNQKGDYKFNTIIATPSAMAFGSSTYEFKVE